MNKEIYYILCAFVLLFAGCSRSQKPVGKPVEDREAKRLMQGVWMDADTESPVFQMKGDTVYYADSTSMPAYFKVIGDTLYIGTSLNYHIEKHTEHLLCITNSTGGTTKYVKSDDDSLDKVFEKSKPQVLTLTEVLKRDTVVFWNGDRYHLYIAINPTRYKVSRHTLNEDGLDVENVYYDNIIHLSIYKGGTQIFSRDFRKPLYEKKVPAHVLSQAILNNMEYDKTDAEGFHLRASVCIPDEAACYMVGHTVSFKGQLTTKVLEY